MVKQLLNKIRGLLKRVRKWNAHEDVAPDRVGGLHERAVLEAVAGFLMARGKQHRPSACALRVPSPLRDYGSLIAGR